MSNIAKTVRSVSLSDAVKGRGYVARQQYIQKLAKSKEPQSACFKTTLRPAVVKSETEITTPPRLDFTRPRQVVFSLQRSLLKFDKLGHIQNTNDDKTLLCSRFGVQKQSDTPYYPEAQRYGSMEWQLEKQKKYQELQRKTYALKHNGQFRPFGSGCFEAPYKNLKIDVTKSKVFKQLSESLSPKDLQASMLGLTIHEDDFLIGQRDVSKETHSLLTFQRQLDRKQAQKASYLTSTMQRETYGFDYHVVYPVRRSLSVNMSKQTGRDGQTIKQTDASGLSKYKWITTSQEAKMKRSQSVKVKK